MSKIHYYAAKNQREKLLKLLNKGVDIDARDEIGRTPLFIAAHEGQHDMVNFLLFKGASIYIEDDRKQDSLHAAAVGLNFVDPKDKAKVAIYFKIIHLLLRHEKKLRKKNGDRFQNIPLLKDSKTNDGRTPLALCQLLCMSIAAPHYTDNFKSVIEGYYPEPSFQELISSLWKDINSLFFSQQSPQNKQKQEETQSLLSDESSSKFKHD